MKALCRGTGTDASILSRQTRLSADCRTADHTESFRCDLVYEWPPGAASSIPVTNASFVLSPGDTASGDDVAAARYATAGRIAIAMTTLSATARTDAPAHPSRCWMGSAMEPKTGLMPASGSAPRPRASSAPRATDP